MDAHFLFEASAYALGFRLYLSRRRSGRMTEDFQWTLLAAVFLGAALGSKALGLLVDPTRALNRPWDLAAWMSGKTIVGGLLGGWIAVEAVKRQAGYTLSTGDDMALPLALGMALGRLGCFLSGLPDNTFGTASAAPWAVDFGDGIPRHPTQLYEALFLLIAGATLWAAGQRPHSDGHLFKGFMAAYLAFRLGVDFLKPTPRYLAGLGAIQFAGALGLSYCLWTLARPRISFGHTPRPAVTDAC